jgi:hypothetical protein
VAAEWAVGAADAAVIGVLPIRYRALKNQVPKIRKAKTNPKKSKQPRNHSF